MVVNQALHPDQFQVLVGFAADHQAAIDGVHSAKAEWERNFTLLGIPFGGDLVGKVLAKLLEIF